MATILFWFRLFIALCLFSSNVDFVSKWLIPRRRNEEDPLEKGK
jgi:hypothetical protein